MAIRLFRGGAGLATRALLLIAVATLPAVCIVLILQFRLEAEWRGQATQNALHQAELAAGNVQAVAEGARQLLVAASAMVAVRRLDPACSDALNVLERELPAYAFLAVLDGEGRIICGTDATAAALAAGPSGTNGAAILAAQAKDALAAGGFRIGRYLPPGAGHGALPFFLSSRAADGRPAVLVAALSLDWLGGHLADLRQQRGAALIVADRDGILLARLPDHPRYVGQVLPERARANAEASARGTGVVTGLDGITRFVGFVPTADPPTGLYVAVGLPQKAVAGNVEQSVRRAILLTAICFVASMLLAWLAARHYIAQPAEAVLRTVRRWREGDLSVRVRPTQPAGSEFGDLGLALNGMAETIQRQQAELHALNDALEVRVTERTQALLASNNRLQVVIAERERSEASFRQAQKLQAVGQLAGGIAHDFNNLLTAVVGSLDLLARRLSPDDERGRGLLRTAEQAAQRGSALTAQLLAFSRKQRLLPRPTDLNGAVGNVVALLESTFTRQIRIDTRLAPDLWPAMVDPNQIEVALLNLALNARDAMPGGGRLLLATRNAVLEAGHSVRSQGEGAGHELPPGSYACLCVADTGTGMTPDVLAQAFEPFFTTKGAGRGSGLGLSQVHGLMHQSGGDVHIRSAPGDGTEVTLWLPRASAPAEEGGPGEPALPPPTPRRDQARVSILLVDDDPEVREITAEILREAGYRVLAAEGGASALAQLEKEGARITLMLVDYAMPGMNGLDLLRETRTRWPHLPAMMITGYAELGRLSEAGLGPDQVMRKPFRPADLIRRIEALLSRTVPASPA